MVEDGKDGNSQAAGLSIAAMENLGQLRPEVGERTDRAVPPISAKEREGTRGSAAGHDLG